MCLSVALFRFRLCERHEEGNSIDLDELVLFRFAMVVKGPLEGRPTRAGAVVWEAVGALVMEASSDRGSNLS